MTYDEIIDAWESERIAYGVVMNYTAHKSAQEARRLSPYIGGTNVDNLSRGAITTAIIDYSNSTIKNKRNAHPSKTTVHKTVKAAKQACKWAHDAELIRKNPFRKIPMPPKGEAKRTFLNERDAGKLLKAAEEYTLENMSSNTKRSVKNASCGLMVVLAMMTGLRRGELLTLKWSDIDFDNKKISVNTALKSDGKEGVPKTKTSVRVLSISNDTVSFLKQYKAYQDALNLNTETSGLMQQSDGRMLSGNTFEHWWRKWADSQGFDGLLFHGLRHTHATLLIANGVDVKTVQARLGHSSAMITLDVYSHALPSLDAAAADELDGILKGGANG